MAVEEISCYRKKLLVTGTNFMPQLKISCHRKKQAQLGVPHSRIQVELGFIIGSARKRWAAGGWMGGRAVWWIVGGWMVSSE